MENEREGGALETKAVGKVAKREREREVEAQIH